MRACLINGIETAAVSVADRGLHYGDGLFETLAVTDGAPELWDRHMRRLRLGCQRLALPMPQEDLLRDEAAHLGAGLGQGVLKLILTRGAGGRGYRPPQHPRTTRILCPHPWPDYPAPWWREGVSLRICRHRLSLNPALAGLKHLNRLDQVLARSEWSDPDIAEGLMLDPLDRVVEGTLSNLFLVISGRLLTPALTDGGVAGVMRGLVMDRAAALGITCTSTPLTLADVRRGDELFVCNSLIGIWPVRDLAGTVFSAPGPLTGRLQGVIEEARRG